MGSKKVLNNYGSFDVVFKSGKGSILTDINGKKYIDFLAGIAVNSLGHNFKPLVKAVSSQAKKQIHVCNYFFSDIGVKYADELLSATGFEGIFFGNSGAEANEAAIKLARKFGQLNGGSKRKTIVTLEHSFHGRTMATLTATGQDIFHPETFAPYVEGFKTIKPNDYDSLKDAFDDTTAALMMECVQGEGGVFPLDKEWAKTAAEAARKAGAIVICDEVQTGMGRTGTLLASEQLEIKPEVVTLAKAIAGGIPMGACLTNKKCSGVLTAGTHGSTFGGNPIACAGGIAVIERLQSEGFLESVSEKAKIIREELLKCSEVASVSGIGMMIGIELKSKKATDVAKKALDNGLLVLTAKTKLRLLPPLTISKEEIEDGLKILIDILEE